MSKTIQQILHEAKKAVLDTDLCKAITTLTAVYDQRPSLFGRDTFETIRDDYHRMVDFMMRGYKDDKRRELFINLLEKLYVLVADLEISWRCKNQGVYVAAFQRAARLNMSPAFLREVLERFVTDVAMLSLEDETTAKTKRRELYDRHQTFADRLFCALFVACQWTEEQQHNFRDIILLPTIDTADALLMVSAVTLSVVNQYDPHKTTMLAEVYQAAQEPALRQRALVGFVLAMRHSNLFYGDNDLLLETCLKDCPRFKDDLVDMHKQVFFCLNTDKDTERIQKDIMPGILKNSNIRVTRFGIEEKEPDALEDILHPDAEDKAMEAVERGMDKMREMLKAGSDIYFGGFAQMKRFPFFSQLSNWFTPFTTDHPTLTAIGEQLDGSRFLENMLEHGTFCDSDKYSFVLALAQVIDRLPKNVREMLGSQEALGELDDSNDTQTDVRCRRLYLQDLYRFFRLHPCKDQMANPFADDKDSQQPAQAFFMAGRQANSYELLTQRMRVARFLYRRHEPQWIITLYQNAYEEMFPPYPIDDEAEYYFIMAHAYLWLQDPKRAQSVAYNFFHLPEEKREGLNEQMQRLMATAMMRTEDYWGAKTYYTQLVERHPDDLSLSLNLCIAQLETPEHAGDNNDQGIAQAMERLFKLNYLHPNNKNVVRVLAWGLLLQGKGEQAERHYQQLLADSPTPADWLNAGYSAWVNGQPAEARDRFVRYVKDSKVENVAQSLNDTFINDRLVLDANGINIDEDIEFCLMIDAVSLAV